MHRLAYLTLLLLSCQSSDPSSHNPKANVPSPSLTDEMVMTDAPSHCPDDMVYVDNPGYCIDRYEAPNQESVYPFYAQTAYQGAAYCHSVGKTLCTRSRWQTACQGPQKKLYPYGDIYHGGTCNDNKLGWIEVPWLTMGTPYWLRWCKEQYKGEPSGYRPACVSDYGVVDMMGNVREWVIDKQGLGGYALESSYWYGTMQGGIAGTCGFVIRNHSPGFNTYEAGFRCCKESQ